MLSESIFTSQSQREIIYKFHDSIARDIIMIDEKSLNLMVRDYTAGKEMLKEGLGYLITVAALTLTLVTSSFHDFVFPAAVWNAFFMLCDLLVAVLAVRSFFAYWRTKIKTPEDLVEKLKSDSSRHINRAASLSPFS